MKLVELWKDWTPEVEDTSHGGRYERRFSLIPNPEAVGITAGKLESYVRRLQEKYPERGFTLRDSGGMLVVDQAVRTAEGRTKGDRVPIFFLFEDPSAPSVLQGLEVGRKRLTSPTLGPALPLMERYITGQVQRELRASDLGLPRIFIPKSFIERRGKRANYLVMRALGSLRGVEEEGRPLSPCLFKRKLLSSRRA